MHPIVFGLWHTTYSTAKFITKILQHYCGKTSTFVKDSTDFIKKIKHLSINPEEETLVSFDVSALFTKLVNHKPNVNHQPYQMLLRKSITTSLSQKYNRPLYLVQARESKR